MKSYIFTLSLLLLLLIAAMGAHASVQDLAFINSGYILKHADLNQLIAFSLKYDVRIEHLQNWIMGESSDNPHAVNPVTHDRGYCQHGHWNYHVRKYGKKGKKYSIWNPSDNLEIALAILGDNIETYGIYHGFIAYNIGRSRVARGEILQDGIEYVNRIFPEQTEKSSVVYFGDNGRMVLTFREQELYDKRGLRV